MSRVCETICGVRVTFIRTDRGWVFEYQHAGRRYASRRAHHRLDAAFDVARTQLDARFNALFAQAQARLTAAQQSGEPKSFHTCQVEVQKDLGWAKPTAFDA